MAPDSVILIADGPHQLLNVTDYADLIMRSRYASTQNVSGLCLPRLGPLTLSSPVQPDEVVVVWLCDDVHYLVRSLNGWLLL